MKRYILLIFLLFSACILSAMQFSTSGNLNTTNEKIELLNADSLLGTTGTVSALIRSYEGNVSFRHGDIRVFCTKAFHNIAGNSLELQRNVSVTQQDMQLSSNYIQYDGNSGIASSPSHITIIDNHTKLNANSGTYSTKTHIADFIGKVSIADDTVSIFSDAASYNRRTMFSNAVGNVLVEDDSSVIIADRIENNRTERITKAFGNVLIFGKYNASYLLADSIENYALTHYIMASAHPVLFKVDTLEKDSIVCNNVAFTADTVKFGKFDTLSVSSDVMESIKTETGTHYICTGNVEVNRSGLQAKAHQIIYNPPTGTISLFGNPTIWMDSTQINADTINIYLSDKELRQVVAVGNAFLSLASDTINNDKINQMLGNTITIDFSENDISCVHANGEAKSLMFMESEKGSEGITNTSADSIRIDFFEGDPSQFVALGGIIGEAVPDNLVMQNIKQYYLPGFKRSYDKPSRKTLPNISDFLLRKH